MSNNMEKSKDISIKNLMIVGVGGQGIILAARILGNLFNKAGYDVKVSEVHGMSQRGGSVVTYLRWGDEVFSPIIDKGEADYILSFELLEAARWVEFLKPESGLLITNTQQIDPMPVISGSCDYPSNILKKLKKGGINVVGVDANKLAVFDKAINLVLLGRLSKELNIDHDMWISVMKDIIKSNTFDANIKSFMAGRAL